MQGNVKEETNLCEKNDEWKTIGRMGRVTIAQIIQQNSYIDLSIFLYVRISVKLMSLPSCVLPSSSPVILKF